jgi:DNA replication protein DnaC
MVMDREPSIANAKKTIQAALERGYGWVYLYGGYGTAKTTMLRVAVAESLRAGLDATYTRMVDMLDEIRAAYDHNKPQEEATRRIRRWMELPVLALDEIEKTQETGFIVERRFQILDHRYEAATRQRAGVTLIAGNVAPEKLGGALGSRIADGRFTVVHITAVDGRPFMKDGKYA